MRILIVEDDPQIGDALGSGLRLCGFGTDWVRSLGAAARALRETDPAAVVLDLKLPDGCGLDLLADLRARASAVPVLILSARSQVTDRICGLDLGADDYVVKPFDIDEIAARLRALIRRAEARSQPRLSHRDIVLDPGTRRVLRDGAPVELTRREFDLLRLLVERKGRVVSRAALEQQLYAWNEDIASNSIEVHIHHLRRKLGNTLISTLRGVGYRLAP